MFAVLESCCFMCVKIFSLQTILINFYFQLFSFLDFLLNVYRTFSHSHHTHSDNFLTRVCVGSVSDLYNRARIFYSSSLLSSRSVVVSVRIVIYFNLVY